MGWTRKRRAAVLALTTSGMLATPTVAAQAETVWVIRPLTRPAGTPPVYLSVGILNGVVHPALEVPAVARGGLDSWRLGSLSAPTFRIYNRSYRNSCITFQSPTDSQVASLQTCPHPSAYQTWQFFIGTPPRLVPQMSPYVTTNPVAIRNTTTHKCLAIAPQEEARAGTRVREYPCTPDDKRRWQVSRIQAP